MTSPPNELRNLAGERWWVPPPAPDESLESVLERTYHIYQGIHLTRGGWFAEVCRAPGDDMRSLTTREIVRLARLLSVPAVRMRQACVPDTPDRLAPAARRAYCPLCWGEDDAAKRPRYFRRCWAQVFMLTCGRHDTPLLWASLPALSIERVPLPVGLRPPSGNAAVVMALIHRFTEVLRTALFEGAPWPDGWRGCAHGARTLLARYVMNLQPQPAQTAAQTLWPSLGLEQLCAPGRKSSPVCRGSPWEVVRSLGPPSSRRAALWLAAWHVVPGLAPSLAPDGVKANPFLVDQDYISHERVGSEGQRLRRLRTAMAGEMMGWFGQPRC